MKTTKKTEAKDIRDLLPRGSYGDGIIDGAQIVIDETQSVPVWEIFISIDGKPYKANKCLLQTSDWDPKKGDHVQFDRQPEGVSDEYLHATLLIDSLK